VNLESPVEHAFDAHVDTAKRLPSTSGCG